jgi:hypothetical protein
MNELDLVVLATDLPEQALKAGDVGTVTMVHRGGERKDGGQASVFWYWAAGERRMAGDSLPGTLHGQVRWIEEVLPI